MFDEGRSFAAWLQGPLDATSAEKEPEEFGPSERGREVRWLVKAAVLVPPVLLLGCSGFQSVTEKEKEMLLKMRTGEYALVKSDVYEQLTKDAEIGKGVGRYQMHTRSFRTWRLDTATGESCLLLTTEEDWEDPKMQALMCE